jgi:transposase-like protein
MDQNEVKKKQRYNEEFKRSVVEHWRNSGKSAVEVAKEFGPNVWNLRDWARDGCF